jgi:hypothetical protein
MAFEYPRFIELGRNIIMIIINGTYGNIWLIFCDRKNRDSRIKKIYLHVFSILKVYIFDFNLKYFRNRFILYFYFYFLDQTYFYFHNNVMN